VRWRYQVTLNAIAVVVPAGTEAELARLPGVRRVYPSVRYRARLDRSANQIGAPRLWGADLSLAGQGMKIGILDDGVDQTHPFFDARGFAMPTGFPKGQAAFATAKVIAARAFPPPTPAYRNAAKPFDPVNSEHGTHVAGIAAGNRGVFPDATRGAIAGIAPGAYIGNYKVLTIPTVSGVGLDGNSPEIAAGIEAAVRDGMDVINLSLGEPEIEPGRDLVAAAIDAAADAGVVAAIAAGNDSDDFVEGAVGSPGSAAKAITAGAVTTTRTGRADLPSLFSSAGPSPLSLRLKPDVAAPGQSILSSVPARSGTWETLSGTSMASPHVAGAAALLLQRHAAWTPAQVKSALVQTAAALEAPPTRVGGGRVDLERANDPRLFAAPSSVSFGLLRPGQTAAASVELTDAGGGAGQWTVAAGGAVTGPPTVSVPGRLELSARAGETDTAGYVVLSRDGVARRIPFWLGVSRAALEGQAATPIARTGTYRATTAGRPALVDEYRFPRLPRGGEVEAVLAGPERVFRVRLTRPVANFGVAVLSRRRGVTVQPRILEGADEARQVGYTALPLNLNPYLTDFGMPSPAAAAIRPDPGTYSIVFDSPTPAGAGPFTFRFWIGDSTPPRLRSLGRRGTSLRVAVSDAGAGVDPRSIDATVDGRERRASLRGGVISIRVGRGRHRVVLQVSDHQESRNMENVPRILPNTARLAVTVR
jgi:subtilisin family serine protease